MTDKPQKRGFPCPECGDPMCKVLSLDGEQFHYHCNCCGGDFLPNSGDPYAGLSEVIHQEAHRGDRKGGSNSKGRFGNQKKPVKRDSVRLHYT